MSQNAGNHYLVDQIENNNNDSTIKEKNTRKSADQPMISSGPLKRRNLGTIPRRRTGKKDRHSKICTAQGIRDRRMRLSLQVARKFFDLQDMMGYDKACETIEWLFSQSMKAIMELSTNKELPISDAKSESFHSECEVVSGIEENSSEKHERKLKKNEQKKSQQTGCKPNTRESRDKARARAR
ncbi:hypothetical protein BUALT_Bualt17G0092900 [Buddleja alternifolia]|uniref:Cycloidea-like protein n=1 Tax=Buddleja alternifolia TaxID=168488 RepID=A0AAV6WI19_9LAMI|nr:hypothetical protein BUALT_Bualt17G0092900 [Buddleja alternifolia]